MRKLHFTQQATDDLRAIARYLAEATGNRTFGTTFTRRLRHRCAELASYPQIMGSHRPEFVEGLRSSSEGSYLIFFRYEGQTFEVVRFVEGHRDLATLFSANTTSSEQDY